jgi:ATP/maltotriose-dependent transcriptional regulator MalT
MPADCVGPGTRFTGLAAAAAGRLEDAERLLTRAVEDSRARGSEPLAVGAEIELARVLLRRGEDERGRALAARCVEASTEMDTPAYRAKAEALLTS